MVLQRGLQVVGDRQFVLSLDQEVVVDSRVLKVVNQGCNVGGQEGEAVGPFALQHATMHHEHVGHLEDRRHVGAATAPASYTCGNQNQHQGKLAFGMMISAQLSLCIALGNCSPVVT